MCGEYMPEGRQVCPACELTRPKELVQIMSKKTDTIIIPGELPDLNQIIALRKICLGRMHHTEAHTIGINAFEDKYHVYGVLWNG